MNIQKKLQKRIDTIASLTRRISKTNQNKREGIQRITTGFTYR